MGRNSSIQFNGKSTENLDNNNLKCGTCHCGSLEFTVYLNAWMYVSLLPSFSLFYKILSLFNNT